MTENGQKMTWAEAIETTREPLPMEPEIWAAGADLETAHFVARMLRQKGYYLVRPDSLEWSDIRRFQDELGKGQGVREDGGGYFVRCIKALFGFKFDPVVTYQDAAKTLLEGRDLAP